MVVDSQEVKDSCNKWKRRRTVCVGATERQSVYICYIDFF